MNLFIEGRVSRRVCLSITHNLYRMFGTISKVKLFVVFWLSYTKLAEKGFFLIAVSSYLIVRKEQNENIFTAHNAANHDQVSKCKSLF